MIIIIVKDTWNNVIVYKLFELRIVTGSYSYLQMI